MKYLISASGGVKGKPGLELLVCYSTPKADRESGLPGVLYRDLPQQHTFSGENAALLLSHYADGSLSLICIQGDLKATINRAYDTQVCYQVSKEDLKQAKYKIGSICASIPRGRLELYDRPQHNIEPLSGEQVPDIACDTGKIEAFVTLLKFAILADYQLLISLPTGDRASWYADGMLMQPISHILWRALDELPLYLRNRATFALAVDESYPQELIGKLCVILHYVSNLSKNWSNTRHLELDWQALEVEAEKKRQIVETYEALLSRCSLPQEYASIDKFSVKNLQKNLEEHVRQTLKSVTLPTLQDYAPYKLCVLVEDRILGITQEKFVNLWLEERLKALQETNELWKAIQELSTEEPEMYQHDQVWAMARQEALHKFWDELLDRDNLSPDLLNELYKFRYFNTEGKDLSRLCKIVWNLTDKQRQRLCSDWSWSLFEFRLCPKDKDWLVVWSIVNSVNKDCIQDWYQGYISMFKGDLSQAMLVSLGSDTVDDKLIEIWMQTKETTNWTEILFKTDSRISDVFFHQDIKYFLYSAIASVFISRKAEEKSNNYYKEKLSRLERWLKIAKELALDDKEIDAIKEHKYKLQCGYNNVLERKILHIERRVGILLLSLVALLLLCITVWGGRCFFCQISASNSERSSAMLSPDSTLQHRVYLPSTYCSCGCSKFVPPLDSILHRFGNMTLYRCPCIQKSLSEDTRGLK